MRNRFSSLISTLTSLLWLLHALPTARFEYSSLNNQLQYVDEERKLIVNLRDYVQAENARLDELKKFANKLAVNVELLASSEDAIAWNPLLVYRIVKDLTIDLDGARETMTRNSYDDNARKLLEESNVELPNEDHLYGEIRNLVRLQRVYDLSVADMMDGRLAPDRAVEIVLTHEDCFHIARMCAERNDYETAVDWLTECDPGLDESARMKATDIFIRSTLFTGQKELCRLAVYNDSAKLSDSRILQDLVIKLGLELGEWMNWGEVDQWVSFRLCAGDYEDEVALRNMKCRYNHRNSPFLTIAPLKEEILSLVPKVSVFREVVYDSEIELLKHDAFDEFATAMVISAEGREEVDVNYRPSQTAFLDNTDPKYTNLYQRLEDISSLSQRHSEPLQMLHYAPGGFYRVHNDYLNTELENGNRIATALMYLNDVTLGGSTVFPRQQLAVRPIKGSILFWINMRVDGSEETLTQHAACPVIYGEKIACTQWFRIGGQDHWIAEPEDDSNSSPSYCVNPNIICRRK